MSEPETPTTEQPSPKPANPLLDVFSQANITTGLAVLAVVLAAAPYLMPKVAAYQVSKGLMSQPVILAQASDALQQQQYDERRKAVAKAAAAAPALIKAHYNEIFNDPADPVIGTGPIKVVEFLDYQCAYCRAATPMVKQFLADNPDVQLVVKEYPVVHPPNSQVLAAAGIEAWRAGRYEAIHYAFLEHNFHPEVSGPIDGDLVAILKANGLDPAKVAAHVNDQSDNEQINHVMALGAELNIDGTPTFIVGNRMVAGADMEGLKAAVQAARAGK